MNADRVLNFITLLFVLFPPHRVKMTAAPYNYSYIFKYIIIGE